MLVATVLCAGCEWLETGGARSFDEIEAAEAQARVLAKAALLVQVRETEAPAVRVGDAPLVELEGPLPPFLAASQVPILIVAYDPTRARRLAARLVRAGVPRVSVVRGGLQAWREGAEASEARAPASEGRES